MEPLAYRGANPDDAVTCEDFFKSIDLLRCPRCGGILHFQVVRISPYYLSDDGKHLIRDFFLDPRNYGLKENLICLKCGMSCEWERNGEGKIVLLEESKQWN